MAPSQCQGTGSPVVVDSSGSAQQLGSVILSCIFPHWPLLFLFSLLSSSSPQPALASPWSGPWDAPSAAVQGKGEHTHCSSRSRLPWLLPQEEDLPGKQAVNNLSPEPGGTSLILCRTIRGKVAWLCPVSNDKSWHADAESFPVAFQLEELIQPQTTHARADEVAQWSV